MMTPLILVITSTFLAGLAMPLGALIANFEHIKSQWLEEELRHSVIAFGGGALMAAIALVLVPEGIKPFNPLLACTYLLLGGISFMALDIALSKRKTPASQLAAMLSDFIPESIALGAAFALGHHNAFLLAGIIGLQNFPEGFNAYRELRESTHLKTKSIILAFSAMSLLGPIAGTIGYLWLADSPLIISGIMLFAAGGILYSIFADIAPQAKLDKHWAPPLGAVLGFALGLIGLMLTEP